MRARKTGFNKPRSATGIDKFTEQGSLTSLYVRSQIVSKLRSQLGMNLRFSSLVKQWVYITPQCFLGWQHDFMNDRIALNSRFASGVGSTFKSYGPMLGADGFIGSLGISIQWRPAFNTSLSVTSYAGREGYTSVSIQLAAQASF